MDESKTVPRRSNAQAVVDFVRAEAAGGFGLALGALVALVWANSSTGSSYRQFWSRSLPGLALVPLPVHTPRDLVDNVAMTVFFLAIGLEVARERAEGSLRDIRNALLPITAALGGMLGAATIYLSVVLLAGTRSVTGGWGVPMATDVAFTLGALALLGTRIPTELRAFVLTLAVADDVASVVVLSIISASKVSVIWVLAAIAVLVVTYKIREYFLTTWWIYVIASLLEWTFLALAGVEPSLAGALVGMLVPVVTTRRFNSPTTRDQLGPEFACQSLERVVHPISTYIILPVFALANTGVVLTSNIWTHPRARIVAIGVLSARVIGKALGITLAVAVLVKLRACRLPDNVRWPHIVGAAVLCGMGFTVPLLFAIVSFPHEPLIVDSAKVALIVGTLVTFVLGSCVIVVIQIRQNHNRSA